MRKLNLRLKKYLWKMFLRIGHDWVWKVDQWFQQQEMALVQPALDTAEVFEKHAALVARDVKENYESDDREYGQDGNYQRAEFADLGGRDGQGRGFHRLSQSHAGRGSSQSAENRPGSGFQTQKARRGNGSTPRNHGRGVAPRQARRKLTAADFDSRMALNLKLAKSRPVMG